jgi:flap endonuclease-1
MGIVGLMKLITEEAPSALKEKEMENLNDRKVAIDASMAIYQFLVAVRTGPSGGGGASMQLTNEAGDVTSHIQGMFNRTIKMMEVSLYDMIIIFIINSLTYYLLMLLTLTLSLLLLLSL